MATLTERCPPWIETSVARGRDLILERLIRPPGRTLTILSSRKLPLHLDSPKRCPIRSNAFKLLAPSRHPVRLLLYCHHLLALRRAKDDGMARLFACRQIRCAIVSDIESIVKSPDFGDFEVEEDGRGGEEGGLVEG